MNLMLVSAKRAFFLGLVLGALPVFTLRATDYPVQPVPFTAVRITGGFWRTRQEVNRTVTVPFALQQCEESGRLKNFDLAADTTELAIIDATQFEAAPVARVHLPHRVPPGFHGNWIAR